MSPVEIIMKKKNGQALTPDEIHAFVRGAVDGSFAPYQLSALLMAICLRGMNDAETAELTLQMARSGEMLDLSAIEGITVDKHSTGGVGDTTTLILAPLVACAGVKVAKMSGRGLGHTGGTLDKLSSIPGMNVALSKEDFIRQVNEIGVAVIGQTGELAPADKALYALRDVTGTVDSLPLIASSIMSKKLASGADVVVLDVKTGSGALMPTLRESTDLARAMVDIGTRAGRRYSAVVTDMNQPLGQYVGNALEVEEAIQTLRGEKAGRLLDVSLLLGAHMLRGAGRVASIAEGEALLSRKIASGEGLEKFAQMIARQGGDPCVTEDASRLPRARTVHTVKSDRSGFLSEMDATAIGNAARLLGAGRMRKEDEIDSSVGIVMKVLLGDEIHPGDALFEIHEGARGGGDEAARMILASLKMSEERPPAIGIAFAEMGGDGIG